MYQHSFMCGGAVRLPLVLFLGWGLAACGGGGSDPGGVPDAGNPDSGGRDGGVVDTGVVDSGRTDSGRTDSGRTDSGRTDSGSPDGGPSCTDEAQNGDETDVDCGGSICEPCQAGADCLADGDCDGDLVCGADLTCGCADGYVSDGVGGCEDVDECTDGVDDCDDNATCTNVAGSFECACDSGYSGDGTTCEDVDECTDGADNCDENATCANTDGGFTCTCNMPDWVGDGETCVAAVDCDAGAAVCDDDATCTSQSSGPSICVCNDGYTGDGTSCEDVDECDQGTDDCDANATCENTVGSFSCTCDSGYSGDGTTCEDVDECADGADDCDENATCANTDGGFTCTCDSGYSGNGVSCSDVDECMTGTHDCDESAGAECTNTTGGFTCACPAGTIDTMGDGTQCDYYGSCAEILVADPTALSGTYTIDTGTGGAVQVHCDMDSDGRVGYTMLRIDDGTLATGTNVQQTYRDACAAYGMELIVPRTRAHASAIAAWNGEPPNVVGVYPKSGGAVGLENWEGECNGERGCRFYLSDQRSSQCVGFEPNGDNNISASLYRHTSDCDYGRWNDAHDRVSIGGYAVCSPNDTSPRVQASCFDVMAAGSVYNTETTGTVSGIYPIDPDGDGTTVDVYCDMLTEGGGWTLVANVAEDDVFTGNWGADSVGTPSFGAKYLFPFDDLGAQGELMMRYNGDDSYFVRAFDDGESWEDQTGNTGRRHLVDGGDYLVLSRTDTSARGIYCAHNGSYGDGFNCDGDSGQINGQGHFNRAAGNELPGCGGFGNSGWKPLANSATGIVCNPADYVQLWFRGAPEETCAAWQAAGSTGTGRYPIDPDGFGGAESFPVYCDLTSDGGGWTIVYTATGANGEQPMVSDTAVPMTSLFRAFNLTRAQKMTLSAAASEGLFRRASGPWITVDAPLFDGFLDTPDEHMHTAVTVTASDGTSADGYIGYSNYNIAGGGDYNVSGVDGETCGGSNTTMGGVDHHQTNYWHLNCSCERQYLYSYSASVADGDAGYDANTALGSWTGSRTCDSGEGGGLNFYAAMR